MPGRPLVLGDDPQSLIRDVACFAELKMDLLKLIDLEHELSTDLGVPVDLVLKSTLRPTLGKEILSEVVYL